MNNLMSGGDLVAFILYQIELGFALEVQSLLASIKVLSYMSRYTRQCFWSFFGRKFNITGSSFYMLVTIMVAQTITATCDFCLTGQIFRVTPLQTRFHKVLQKY